jgi:predicted nucleic acid-binding protein
MSWIDGFSVEGTAPGVLVVAADLAATHQLDIWDAVILSAASAAGCSLLLSEDLQDGFIWGGVTVVNPFAESLHPLLASALDRHS